MSPIEVTGSCKKLPELSQRGEIRMGYRCNARCDFCYYKDRLDTPKDQEPTYESLLDHLRQLHRHGAREVEFTGGEPTIRSDLVSLIIEARTLGFLNISMITNGLRLANPAYAKKLIDAGLNDCLISIHGHTAELHDRHTNIQGSFDKAIKAAENVLENGARLRVSTTVTGINHFHLDDIVTTMIDLGAACIHLPVFSPVSDAGIDAEDDMYVSYTDAAASIKSAIDRNLRNLPPLSVKYIPFCFLVGYEKYVMNLYQQSHDPDDWNYYWSNKLRRTNNRLSRMAFDGLVSAVGTFTRRRVQNSYPDSSLRKLFGLIRIVEFLRKRRPGACQGCKFDYVCDHVWKGYIDHYGESEIRSVPGEKIVNPVWAYEMAYYRAPAARLTAMGNNQGAAGTS